MGDNIKLFKYPNGFILKRKNKRIKTLNSSKGEERSFVQLQIFDKTDGHFAGVKNERGIKTVTIHLTDETLELLAQMIIHHLNEKRK